MAMEMGNPLKKKRILIGIDASINSKIAAEYIRNFLGCRNSDCEVVLLHIIPRTKSEEEKKVRGIDEERERVIIKGILLKIKDGFVRSGFNQNAVKMEIIKGEHDTVAEGILEYSKKGDFFAVVLGRRGISKAEEFLFGSVTQKVVSEAKGCAVWVVEPECVGGENV